MLTERSAAAGAHGQGWMPRQARDAALARSARLNLCASPASRFAHTSGKQPCRGLRWLKSTSITRTRPYNSSILESAGRQPASMPPAMQPCCRPGKSKAPTGTSAPLIHTLPDAPMSHFLVLLSYTAQSPSDLLAHASSRSVFEGRAEEINGKKLFQRTNDAETWRGCASLTCGCPRHVR